MWGILFDVEIKQCVSRPRQLGAVQWTGVRSNFSKLVSVRYYYIDWCGSRYHDVNTEITDNIRPNIFTHIPSDQSWLAGRGSQQASRVSGAPWSWETSDWSSPLPLLSPSPPADQRSPEAPCRPADCAAVSSGTACHDRVVQCSSPGTPATRFNWGIMVLVTPYRHSSSQPTFLGSRCVFMV